MTRNKVLSFSAALALLTISIPVSAGTTIKVKTPEGSVPALPYQIYERGEWHQVRWENSSLDEEKREAGLPAGSRYEISGTVLGSSEPVVAKVKVVSSRAKAPSLKARTLPLSDVTLTGDNRLTSNRELDIDNLLRQDITMYLYNYRDTYGLSTEGYSEPEGWDSRTTKLKGHGSGHYMSALAFAYAGAQSDSQKAELLSRIRRMVDELRECQEITFVRNEAEGRWREARDLAPERADAPEGTTALEDLLGTWEAFDEYKQHPEDYGYGYLNAIPAQHPVLVEMYRPYHNEKWVWAPYYTIHKQLAGLIDIADNVDDAAIAQKARLIATDMGLWVWNRLKYRTYVSDSSRERPGNRAEMWNMYIAGELGGMAEALSRLSEMEPDMERSQRLLEAASFFDAPVFFGNVSQGVDDIRGRHANQHIPMIIGALREYRDGGDSHYWDIASNFWNLVQGRYVYATGGVGNGEMFREPYTQMASMISNGDPTLNETCCAYNLAKLTRDLACFNPDDAALMDYYERVLYNQIVGSLHPEHYGVTYQYAVGLNARKPFGNETPQSTCCGGTGAENHVKYQEAAYFVSDEAKTVWVALYMPSVAVWKEQGITLEQDCTWPAERSTIRVREGSGRFTMKLRIPSWATSGVCVKVNGKALRRTPAPSSYVSICRNWKAGDSVEIVMPFSVHFNYGADRVAVGASQDSTWLGAMMLGPLVMSAGGVDSWDAAELDPASDFVVERPSDAQGRDFYTVRSGDLLFRPDYSQTGRTTHYFRIK